MKDLLIQKAQQLGFDGCRVTAAEPPGSAGHFQNWLEAGRHGEMGYLVRNAPKRSDPRLVLEQARSIITLAASYDSDFPSLNGSGSGATWKGRIARYACHEDYHEVLAGPLRDLADFVIHLGGTGTRALWYVDTGPFLERDLAQRAGLGFVGKHTNLIHRTLGNWFFLAEIITTLDIPPDSPERNRCGSCTRCLQACPTEAFVGPFQLDARRCISYLTIELKGAIPEAMRPGIGNRIFGCDDCLEVCPWNRFAREGRLMRSHGRPDLAEPDLLELLKLDEPAFRSRFRGTPLYRAKRRGVLRNVCVALGNIGDGSALHALHAATSDAEPLVAEHARWAIDQIEARMARASSGPPPP